MAVGAGAYILAKFAVSCHFINQILNLKFNQTWIKSRTSSYIVPPLLFLLCLASEECSMLQVVRSVGSPDLILLNLLTLHSVLRRASSFKCI